MGVFMLQRNLRKILPWLSRGLLVTTLVVQLGRQTHLPAEEWIEQEAPEVYVGKEASRTNPVVVWAGGLAAILCCGLLGYGVGRNLGDKDKEGDKGHHGPAGPRGMQGIAGTPGTYGSAGKQGKAGPQGHVGASGCQGEQGSMARGSDDLSFYFFNGCSIAEATLVGIVTTPEAKQFTTAPILAKTGAFTQEYPLCQAPIGVYHLTIVPDRSGYHTATEVTVLKQGIKDTVLKYPQGIYKPQVQITVDYTYYPN
jgi:hypothetical protein